MKKKANGKMGLKTELRRLVSTVNYDGMRRRGERERVVSKQNNYCLAKLYREM